MCMFKIKKECDVFYVTFFVLYIIYTLKALSLQKFFGTEIIPISMNKLFLFLIFVLLSTETACSQRIYETVSHVTPADIQDSRLREIIKFYQGGKNYLPLPYKWDELPDENTKAHIYDIDLKEEVTPNEPVKEESKNETKEEIKNPETSDNIIIYALLALAGIGGVTYTSKKLLKHN